MPKLDHLFRPLEIGNLTAKNRLLMSAMSINFGVNEKGWVTEQLTAYLAARAKGGAGMILMGGGGIHPSGAELPDLPAIWDDECIPALKKATDTLRPHGALFGVQVMHGGRQSYHDQKVAPSPIPAPAVVNGIPRELTVPEIHELAVAFGESARRCREGGFDFIEIHAAHGYLINQFMSPSCNRRTDEYGGSFENRIRFLLEVMEEIRNRAGADFPVGIRINGEDYFENGWTLADAVRLAPVLQAEGAAYLNVSAGVYGSSQLTIPSMYVEHGCFVHLAEAVKATVSIPVFTAGRIKSAVMADRIIGDGRADAVAMGRALLADPELPNKARAGEFDRIRPCIGCCVACIHAVLALEPGSCVVNPDVGREYLHENDGPPAEKKTVLVVGAGPAGLSAARLAAEKGHRVTVCEQNGQTGGAGRLAAQPPGRSEIGDFMVFLERELSRLQVEIRLNTAVSDSMLDAEKPDVVIIATGSLAELPLIKGLFHTELDVCTAEDILNGRSFAGRRTVIFGGNQIGLAVADFIAEQGNTVTVLHRGAHFAEELSSNDRYYLRERLNRHTVRLIKNATIEKIGARDIRFHSAGEETTIANLDTLVICDYLTPIRKPLELLKSRPVDVLIIGDAKSPRTLQFAITEGEEAARSL